MLSFIKESREFQFMARLSVFACALLLMAAPDAAMAKRGGDDKDRSRFYGIIEKRPQNELQGEWVIGGQTFIATPGTEFDQADGPLEIGSCAKVEVRNGRVHEIDSESMEKCE